jgi:GST-like protein
MRIVFMQVSSVDVFIMSYNRTVNFPADFPITRKWPPRHYGAGELVGIEELPNVQRALAAFVARPAVARAVNIPSRSSG